VTQMQSYTQINQNHTHPDCSKHVMLLQEEKVSDCDFKSLERRHMEAMVDHVDVTFIMLTAS